MPRTYSTLMSGLFILSTIVNVGLARLVVQRRSATAAASVKLGTVMPELDMKDTNGKLVHLTYGSVRTPTVVYFFSPLCHYCQRNIANMSELSRQAGNRYRIVGVTIETKDLREFINKSNEPFPIYTEPTQTVIKGFHFGGTPQTFVVGVDGRLKQGWTGAYDGALRDKVATFFGVQFPGLLPEPPKTAGLLVY